MAAKRKEHGPLDAAGVAAELAAARRRYNRRLKEARTEWRKMTRRGVGAFAEAEASRRFEAATAAARAELDAKLEEIEARGGRK